MKRILKELLYMLLGIPGLFLLLVVSTRAIGKSIVEGSLEGLQQARAWKAAKEK